jgi:hypothetical protein
VKQPWYSLQAPLILSASGTFIFSLLPLELLGGSKHMLHSFDADNYGNAVTVAIARKWQDA